MSEEVQRVPHSDSILTAATAAKRMLLLAELQSALAAEGVHSVLARHHRLILRYDGPYKPSGLTDPQLHVFTPDGTDIATADGTTYRLASGREFCATDPAMAAAAICGSRRPSLS